MKKASILLVLVAILSVTDSFARRGRITYGTVEKLETVADLPNAEAYKMTDKTDDGKEVTGYLDLAVKYTRFEVCKLPFWINEEPVLVGISTLYKDRYYDIPVQELDEILKENNLDKGKLLHLGFMDKYLGWLVLFGLLALGWILRKIFPEKEEKPDEIE